jgi:hypothetical protein
VCVTHEPQISTLANLPDFHCCTLRQWILVPDHVPGYQWQWEVKRRRIDKRFLAQPPYHDWHTLLSYDGTLGHKCVTNSKNCVVVYYCSAYYKAVRVGEGDSGGIAH